MSQHACSCGREFKCAETLKRHAAITGHPVVLREAAPAVAVEVVPEVAQPDLTQTIEWALTVLANKRAEQERYESQLRVVPASPTPWWARVKSWVGLAA